MQFIDTHCHLDALLTGRSSAEIVREAENVGVTCLVVPAVARHNFSAVRELCEQHSACASAYGIHPCYVGSACQDDLASLRDYLCHHRPVAVGEIGLDFFYPDCDEAQQVFYFVEQLKLAREFDLPVLLHLRRAQDVALKYLRQIKVKGGIAHAFGGSHQQAAEFVKLGFKLGFGGAMTYPRATRLRHLASVLPLSDMVLETDAPDMPPAFLPSGEPNSPVNLPEIAAVLAALRSVSVEEIARMTTAAAYTALPGLVGKGD